MGGKHVKALVTGASSGIGRDIALYLNSLGYKLILVGRDYEALEEVRSNCQIAKIITCDLSRLEEVYHLYNQVKEENIDLLVNNAGFGLFGYFNETKLTSELEMINVNVTAYHVLTKLFLKDFMEKDAGYILNVASAAGFMSGPYMGAYYASKNYIVALTSAIYEDIRRQKKDVQISCLCPGPVDTDFNNRAGGYFSTGSLSSKYVAKYAVDKMLKGKLIIIPGLQMKMMVFLTRFLPRKLMLKIIYQIQKNKTKSTKM